MSLIQEIKKIKSGKKELREFGLVVGGVFGVIAALLWWRHRHYQNMAIFAAALIIPGLVYPPVLKPLQKVWMGFAVIMGSIMSRVILGVLFFFALTPLSVLSRLFGKKYLNMNFREPVESYWIKRPKHKFDKTQYEKQY